MNFTRAKLLGPANHFGLANSSDNHYPERARIKGLVERQLCGTFSFLPLSCLLSVVLTALLFRCVTLLPALEKILHQLWRLGLHKVGEPALRDDIKRDALRRPIDLSAGPRVQTHGL